MDFLDNINNNTLIICNNSLKENILLKLAKENKLINLKFMTKKEFLNNYFFTYNEETIYYIKEKYKVNIEISRIYLDNIKYVINSNINNSKVKFLQELYKDLKNKDLIKYNKLFKSYLENKEIIVIDNYLDKFIINILNKYNTKYLDLNNKIRDNNTIYHFNDIDMEVEFVFNKISLLIKNNININNIKLILLGSEYKSVIKRFKEFYKIPINNLEETSLYKTIESKKFLDLIKNNISKEELFKYLEPNLNEDIYNKFLNIINKYYFIDNLNDVRDFIECDLKNTYLKENKYINAVEIISLDSNLISNDNYVFILGFNQENIPKTFKDIDYLSDSLKELLNISTSIDNNKLERVKIINNINNIKNIYISYKDNSPYNSYYPSNLISDLNMTVENISLENNTSNLYNKVKLTNYLDNLLKYGVKDININKLYNTYHDIKYLKYDNSFKKINNFNLDKVILSYTSLNNYYHCGFRYYIDSILKLNIYEESFKQFIGTMFHDILSRMYNDNFNLDYEWDNYLKNKTFTKKEIFYLKDLKIELENIIKVLKYHYSLTGLTNLKLEQTITINYDDKCTLTGIIDKIMFKERDSNTYISIIDYKTGTPNINMSNLLYGLDMQLPIYVYLTLKSNIFNNPKIIGFCLEKILHEKSSSVRDLDKLNLDNMKLIGYTIDDPYLISMFDKTYENSEMIKSMKTTSKGFAHYSKVLSSDAINNLSTIVEKNIKEAFKLILQGEFKINPKVINGENIGCRFCKYNDLCFKTGKDLVYLKGENDLSFLEE